MNTNKSMKKEAITEWIMNGVFFFHWRPVAHLKGTRERKKITTNQIYGSLQAVTQAKAKFEKQHILLSPMGLR